MTEVKIENGIPSGLRLEWFIQACISQFETDLKERWEHLGDHAEASAYSDLKAFFETLYNVTVDGQHITQSTVLMEEFRLPTGLTGRQQVVELVKTHVKVLTMLDSIQGEEEPNALEQAERRFWQLALSPTAQNEIVKELTSSGVATKGAAARIKYPTLISFPAEEIRRSILERSTLLGDWKADFVLARVSVSFRSDQSKDQSPTLVQTSTMSARAPNTSAMSSRGSNADGGYSDPRIVQASQWDRKLSDKDRKLHHFPKHLKDVEDHAQLQAMERLYLDCALMPGVTCPHCNRAGHKGQVCPKKSVLVNGVEKSPSAFFYERKLPPRLLQLHRAAESTTLLVSSPPEASRTCAQQCLLFFEKNVKISR